MIKNSIEYERYDNLSSEDLENNLSSVITDYIYCYQ